MLTLYVCSTNITALARSVLLTASLLASLEANVGILLPGAAEALGCSGRLAKSDRLMTKNFPSFKLLTRGNFCHVMKNLMRFKLLVNSWGSLPCLLCYNSAVLFWCYAQNLLFTLVSLKSNWYILPLVTWWLLFLLYRKKYVERIIITTYDLHGWISIYDYGKDFPHIGETGRLASPVRSSWAQ